MTGRNVPAGFASIDAVIDAVCTRADCAAARQRGAQVVLSPCPLCRKPGDKFAISTETGLWNCPRCGERGNAWQLVERVGLAPIRSVVPRTRPREGAPPARRAAQAEVDQRWRTAVVDFESSEVVRAYVQGRGITLETARAWGLGSDGTKVCFPYRRSNGTVAFLKWRDVHDKKVMYRWPPNDERPAPVDDPLFCPSDLDPACAVILTEGEWDAMSLGQVGYANVASVANGAAGWKPEWSRLLAPCKAVYLAYDQDADGEKAVMERVRQLGREVVLRLTFGEHKDANDALRAGWGTAQFEQAYQQARRFRPEILISAVEVAQKLADQAIGGHRAAPILTGHREFDTTQRGLRTGEVTALTAHTGSGKTTFVLDLLLRLAERHVPVLLFSMEQGPSATTEQLMGMLRHQHVADASPDEVRAAADAVPEWIYLGTEPEVDRVEQVVEALRYGVKVYDVRVAAIDHLDYLIDPRERETQAQAASRAVKAIARAAAELDVNVLLICQPTTASGRDSHRLTIADMAETRLTRQLAHNAWVITSRKDARELTLQVAKARYGPARDGISLRYRFDGFRFDEIGVSVDTPS